MLVEMSVLQAFPWALVGIGVSQFCVWTSFELSVKKTVQIPSAEAACARSSFTGLVCEPGC